MKKEYQVYKDDKFCGSFSSLAKAKAFPKINDYVGIWYMQDSNTWFSQVNDYKIISVLYNR